MFKTPALEEFWLIWYLQPTQFPDGDWSGAGEFLTERLIEDIADGKSSIAVIVLETKIPEKHSMLSPQSDVAVQFKILCTKDMARELIELGYKVQDRDEPDDDEGCTWEEFLSLVNGRTRDRREAGEWTKPIRLTDDNDPNAPWFKVTGIKEDDDGYFIAIEEIQV